MYHKSTILELYLYIYMSVHCYVVFSPCFFRFPGSHNSNPTESYLSSVQGAAQQQMGTPTSALAMNGGVAHNSPYVQYQNNMTAFATTSVYGHPLMTPGTTGGVVMGGGASQLWYPGQQANAYDTSQMYYYKPGAPPKGSGFGNQIIPNHS